jgi:hypothetical protein
LYYPSPLTIDRARCRSEDKFFSTLKTHDVRFTTNYNPTSCPLHDTGPAFELLLLQEKSRQQELLSHVGPGSSDKQKSDLADCTKEVGRLQEKFDHYEIHLKQFEICRKTVKDYEEALVPGQMVMFRDFVNQHNASGKKVNNLVLVFLYREEEGEDIRKLAVHNFCTDAESQSCSAWFTKDVLDHHLSTRSKVSIVCLVCGQCYLNNKRVLSGR